MASQCKSLFRKVLFSFLPVFFVSSMAIAQGNGGGDPDFPDTPLDGGLSLLLVAGAAYGGKKVHEYRNARNKKSSEEK